MYKVCLSNAPMDVMDITDLRFLELEHVPRLGEKVLLPHEKGFRTVKDVAWFPVGMAAEVFFELSAPTNGPVAFAVELPTQPPWVEVPDERPTLYDHLGIR